MDPAFEIAAACGIARSQDVDGCGQPRGPATPRRRPSLRSGRGSGRPGAGGLTGWPTRRRQRFRTLAMPLRARRLRRPPRGTSARDRTAEPRTSVRPPRARPTPPARRGLVGSLVRQRASDTVTDRRPVLARGLAGQDPSCPSFNSLSPRPLHGRFVVICRPLKADQELGDQACAFLLRQRECLAKQCLRMIGHGQIVPLDLHGSASNPQRATGRTCLPRRCLLSRRTLGGSRLSCSAQSHGSAARRRLWTWTSCQPSAWRCWRASWASSTNPPSTATRHDAGFATERRISSRQNPTVSNAQLATRRTASEATPRPRALGEVQYDTSLWPTARSTPRKAARQPERHRCDHLSTVPALTTAARRGTAERVGHEGLDPGGSRSTHR